MSLTPAIREALAERYVVEGELGRGGMATVYLARDPRHERQVAIKVLRPELAVSLGVPRFLQEIKLAAGLTHPHILPVFDSGDANGLLYYVMPHVEGESLRDRVRREKQLAIHEAIQVTREIADALGYAHSRGIVHRDIKPENILFTGGHAVLSDFGIARAISAAGGEHLTETGLAIGTPVYMSPEQAAAQEVDARSDLYSLGCVLYEMLGGEPPFTGPTPQAVLARHATDPVPPVRTIRATVPAAIEAALKRVLAKVPADRYATAEQFAEALTASDAEVAPRLSRAAAEQSIAVLPFTNMSADPENEYFSDGMTEEIINALTQIPGLHVAARTSSFAFKGKNAEIRTIGRALNVSKVLEGSVRQAGTRLRLTAQLINVADGYHLWSQRYDRSMADVFDIQDELTLAMVEALKDHLSPDVERDVPAIKRGTDNLEAYHLYLKGRHFWEKRALPKALECFQRAIALDPAYPAPYAGVADAFSYLGHYGLVPTPQAAPKAIGAAERAVALDDDLADAHFSLGLARLFFWYLDEAEAELRRAIALNPQHAVARGYLGVYVAATGRAGEVADAVEPALKLEPLSPIVNGVSGIAYFWGGHFERALACFDKALEIDPTFIPALYMRGTLLTQQGRHTEGISALERAAQALPCSLTLHLLGVGYADAGEADRAREVVARLRRQREETYATALSIGAVLANLGDMDEALDWVERAFAERNTFAWAAAFWGGMEHLASHPRYIAQLNRAGLARLALNSGVPQPRDD